MAAPKEMRVIAFNGSGGTEVLQEKIVPVPATAPGQVLIRVHAAGVNRPDIAQRQGLYPPPAGAPDWPGLEVAGEIAAMGDKVSGFAVGDRVMALLAGGGYAEYAAADFETLLPLPDNMDYVAAAGIPETFFTVWSNVFDRAALKSGEILLVHGGSSGIGTAAIQLAKAFGARVIVTAGSAEKCQACLRLGADYAVNYREQDFVAAAEEWTQGAGVNVILDMIGGDYAEKNYKAAAVEGRIVQIAFLRGHKATVNLNLLMRKRLVHTGSTLRARDKYFKGAVAQALRRQVLPLWQKGALFPVIDSVFPLSEAAKAHETLEEGNHIGKIVLKVI